MKMKATKKWGAVTVLVAMVTVFMLALTGCGSSTTTTAGGIVAHRVITSTDYSEIIKALNNGGFDLPQTYVTPEVDSDTGGFKFLVDAYAYGSYSSSGGKKMVDMIEFDSGSIIEAGRYIQLTVQGTYGAYQNPPEDPEDLKGESQAVFDQAVQKAGVSPKLATTGSAAVSASQALAIIGLLKSDGNGHFILKK